MPRKVLIFFPHKPWPPRSGAHRRCLQLLAGFQALGCEINFCSTTLLRVNYWNEPGSHPGPLPNDRVHVHRRSFADFAVAAPLYGASRLLGRDLAVNSRAYCPPGLTRYFRRLVAACNPDVLVMNYAYWDRLLDHQLYASKLRLIDTHDLLLLNRHWQAALRRWFPRRPLQLSAVPDHVLAEDFFVRLPAPDMTPEFQIYDRYDVALAISQAEAERIRAQASHARTVYLPMTQDPRPLENTYAGPALLAAGDNIFNVHGYAYFAQRVLPEVRRQLADFELQVTGACCPWLCPAPNVTLAGFLPNLAAAYATARCVICPTFGGTGQQVKIVEAMAHGVPVVALASAAKTSPLRHGENGLVAANAAEFAAALVELWRNPALRRRLGEAARRTIAEEFSQERLVGQLAEVLDRPR